MEPLGFMKNSTDLGNNINYSEEIDLHVDFKRTVRNSQQNSKYLSKRKPPLIVNVNLGNPKNQTIFSKVPIFPVDKFWSDAVTKKNRSGKYIDFQRQHTK